MFPVFFNVSFHFLKLINTLVVHVDLQRFRPEFRAFHITFTQVLNLFVIVSPITVTVKTVRSFLCVQPFVHLPSNTHPHPNKRVIMHAHPHAYTAFKNDERPWQSLTIMRHVV